MALKAKPLHILLVDDDTDLVDVTNQTLTKLGHRVTCRSDSLNGLKIFSEQPGSFDMAILDVSLADIPGLELAQRFRRIQPGFPVILWGGDLDCGSMSEGRPNGVSCIQKPISKGDFELAIREALKH